MCWTLTISKQAQITKIRHESSNKQLGVKTNRTSFFAEIVPDITARNKVRKDTKWDNTKNKKDEQHGPHQENWG